jgi:formate dehydrogenase subunit delta
VRIERLVAMANDIGAFFDAEPDKAEGAKSVANHLRRFWDPRMRRQIIAHYRAGGGGLKDVSRAAIGLLAAEAAAPPPSPADPPDASQVRDDRVKR